MSKDTLADRERFQKRLKAYVATTLLPTRTGFALTHTYDYRLALQDPQSVLILNHFLPKRVPLWNAQTLRLAIKENGIRSRTQLARFSTSAYNFAWTVDGLMDELFPRGRGRRRPVAGDPPMQDHRAWAASHVAPPGPSEPLPAPYDWI